MSDLIKREDAIKALHKHFSSGFDNDRWWNSTTVLFALNSIPSADRPQGEWVFDPEILCSDIGVYSAGYRCSECGKDYFKVDGMHYCPNCGARMKGADDDNSEV